jgi:hypothetical protein
MESKIEINAIVWSTNIETARKYAKEFTCDASENQNNYYETTTPEYKLNTYVRCPTYPVSATPSSITDIVIIQIEDTEDLIEAKKYLDSRRGIPMRVCLTTKLGEFDELECKLVNPSQLASERNVVLKEALSFERTLVNVFKKFDLNGNGFISTEELMSCSKELGHDLSHDDAKMITDTLDRQKSGNIDFNGFKKWWVTGKSDFSNFRRIVKAEMAVKNLVKMTSTNFNDYLTNLNNNSNDVASSEVQQSIEINLHAQKDFENGIGVFFDVSSGAEAKEIMNSFHEGLRNSPVFLTLSLEMADNETAAQTAEILNQMVMPMLNEIPEVSNVLMMGVNLELRAVQNKIILQVTISSMFAEIIANTLNEYNTSQLKMSAECTIHMFTNVDVNDLYSNDLSGLRLLEKFLNMKMHFTTKAYNLRSAVESVCGMMDDKIQMGVLPNYFSNIVNATRFGSVLRNFSLDLKFDPSPLVDMLALDKLKEFVGTEGYSTLSFGDFRAKVSDESANSINDSVSGFRNLMPNYINMFTQMKEMVPPEFIDIVKALNTERIEIHYGVNHQNLALSSKITLNLPKLNVIRDQVLNN